PPEHSHDAAQRPRRKGALPRLRDAGQDQRQPAVIPADRRPFKATFDESILSKKNRLYRAVSHVGPVFGVILVAPSSRAAQGLEYSLRFPSFVPQEMICGHNPGAAVVCAI